MKPGLLLWDVYEVTSKNSALHGVMLRGRIRKLGIDRNCNVLVDNAQDLDNTVRFCVLNDADKDIVFEYLKSIIDDVKIDKVLSRCPNPVLSKLKVNIESRYSM